MVADAGTGGPRVVVIGAGPGGYPAAFHAADLGMQVTLIDGEANPGGVCLYRGCIPSKALLHVAALLHETEAAAAWAIRFGAPTIDLATLRQWKNGVVGKLTRGLGSLSKQRRVHSVQGWARFHDAHSVAVTRPDGSQESIAFDYAVIATGSQPAGLSALRFPSPRVMDSTAALELEEIPERLLVVGGGYIGLELGTVYAALGSHVTVVELTSGLLPGVDPDLVEPLARDLKRRFQEILLDTRVTDLEGVGDGIRVTLAGMDLQEPQRTFDKVLLAVGRRPNSHGLGLETTRVQVNPRGFIETDDQRRTAEPHIFAIGDVAGEPMLAHKATHEARVAVEAMAGQPARFDPQAIPAVVFTDPEIAWCGLTEAEARSRAREVKVVRFPWAASGRATTIGRTDGLTKLIIDRMSERIVGVGIVGAGAGEMIAEAALAIEMGALARDLELTVHAHPTLSETIMEAAALFFGHSPHFLARD